MRRARRSAKQLDLPLRRPPTWGGARENAGRKKTGVVPHARRPDHVDLLPVHVTLRLARHVVNLRSQRSFAIVEGAIRRANRRGLVRIVQFSVQTDHVHLLVESVDRHMLAAGIKGFEVRLARGLNELMRRSGRAFGDRYHARALRSPREVRNALVYVLNNRVHHAPHRTGEGFVDPYSSGPFFDGWTRACDPSESACAETGPPTLAATKWLLETGWRKRGLIVPGRFP
jgi:putative transposase